MGVLFDKAAIVQSEGERIDIGATSSDDDGKPRFPTITAFKSANVASEAGAQTTYSYAEYQNHCKNKACDQKKGYAVIRFVTRL